MAIAIPFEFDGRSLTESFDLDRSNVELVANLSVDNEYFIQVTEGTAWTIAAYGPGGTIPVPGFGSLIDIRGPTTGTNRYIFTPKANGEYHFYLGTSIGGVVGHDTFFGGSTPIPLGNLFNVLNTTTGASINQSPVAYVGPVAGLTSQFIDVTGANLNVTAHAANSFIHTGAGFDAINVSPVNGNNVLDGGSNSNFLTGGTGLDTFFVDARDPTQTVWSTVVNFHAGDNATVWGLTQADFQITNLDNQGAVGFTGLTMVAHQAGRADATLTLVGYSAADLSNGRLQVSFGRTPDLPNLAGSNFMRVEAH